MSELLARRWALLSPSTKIHQIILSETQLHHGGRASVRFTFSNNSQPSLGGMMGKNKQGLSFYVVRDDLLHPGKLDGLLPILEHLLVTDVVRCYSLGVIRLVEYLSQTDLFGREQPIKLAADAGTATTDCLRDWSQMFRAAMGGYCSDAESIEGYKKQEERLISDFKMYCGLHLSDHALNGLDGGIVQFGNVLEGEVEVCQQIAKQTGVLVDPIYTLAAWEHAMFLCQNSDRDTKVVMLHTGGTLGMFGLAQR
ncbi:hypothetical protein NE237_021148 [Protea cynaroides]|uniref:D-cysteine desulfhydrase 2, mitochondrial n=1 Tax=Protea cynaroides TaxID=273540 RepID=A0A9Q0HAM0_9MAGN|nr:hypothetical protein NE237_021148 [Protea cynaroides]